MSKDLFDKETEDFGPDIITLEDEDGAEHVFEVVDDAEINGLRYLAVVPYTEGEDEEFQEEVELLIMRAGQVDGEEVLDIVEDEDELAHVAKVFAGRLEELFEIDIDALEDEEE